MTSQSLVLISEDLFNKEVHACQMNAYCIRDRTYLDVYC